MKEYTKINKKYARNVFEVAKEVFGGGIIVKSDVHPCGWDFISFEDYDNYDMIEENCGFVINDISNAIYDYHPFEGKTLLDILEEAGMNGWVFEESQINW
jgi:hypothetical protein